MFRTSVLDALQSRDIRATAALPHHTKGMKQKTFLQKILTQVSIGFNAICCHNGPPKFHKTTCFSSSDTPSFKNAYNAIHNENHSHFVNFNIGKFKKKSVFAFRGSEDLLHVY